MATIERLGLTPVKGVSWHSLERVQVDANGVVGDRLWAPVWPDLVCVRATDFPSMVGLHVAADELPEAKEALFGGQIREVRYYQRHIPSVIHRGRLAERLSDWVRHEVRLARSDGGARFIWSSPVSVLLRSELDHLPGDVDRYRANIVLDDRDAPLSLRPGDVLRFGEVELEVERELDRCIVINHNPLTGAEDRSLLKSLRPGARLAYGCRVTQAGELEVGATLKGRSDSGAGRFGQNPSASPARRTDW